MGLLDSIKGSWSRLSGKQDNKESNNNNTYDSIQQSLQEQWKNNVDLDLDDASDKYLDFVKNQDPFLIMGCIGTLSFVMGFRMGRRSHLSRFKRWTNLTDIPSIYIGPEAPWLRGRVVSVSDGDTIRLWHVPTRLFHSSKFPEGAKVSELAWPIRICTIDTPETSKFGKPGQPFGPEAKDHLTNLVGDQMVHVKLLTTDQYGRAVAEVCTTKPFWPFWKYADQEQLQAGLAEVYQGGGAVYGHKGKEAYLAMQEKAKSQGKGIWSDKSRESAAEFKARMKQQEGS